VLGYVTLRLFIAKRASGSICPFQKVDIDLLPRRTQLSPATRDRSPETHDRSVYRGTFGHTLDVGRLRGTAPPSPNMPAIRPSESASSNSPQSTSDRLQRFRCQPASKAADHPMKNMPIPFFVDSDSDVSPHKPGPSRASGVKQEQRRTSAGNGQRQRDVAPVIAPDVEEESKEALRIKLSKLDSEVSEATRARS